MPEYGSSAYELGIRDLSGLIANFHALDEDLQTEIRAAVKESAGDTRTLTEMLAPKDTGFMSEHVLERITESGFGFDVGWDAGDFFEAGFAFYPFYQEFGTSIMAAQPSLGPAWEEVKPQHRERIRAAAQRAVQRRATRSRDNRL
jgi:HK97 gp10 family phage protein